MRTDMEIVGAASSMTTPGGRSPLTEVETARLLELIRRDQERNGPSRRVRSWLRSFGKLPPEMR